MSVRHHPSSRLLYQNDHSYLFFVFSADAISYSGLALMKMTATMLVMSLMSLMSVMSWSVFPQGVKARGHWWHR